MFKNILILGATGLAGSIVIQELLTKKNHFSLIGIATTGSQYEMKKKRFLQFESQGVKIVLIEYSSKDSLVTGFNGFDVVLSFLGPALLTKQIEIADAALTAGVQRFYPSEYGSDTTLAANMKEAVFRAKINVASHLKKLANENSGFSYTIVSTGLLMDYIFHWPNYLGLEISKRRAHLTGDGNSKFSIISLADAGKYIIESLLHPEVSKNSVLRFQSSEMSWNEMITILETVQGVKYDISYESIETTAAAEAEAWQKGDFSTGSILSLKRVIALGNAKICDPDNSKFPGVKPKDFMSFAKDAITSRMTN